MRLQGWRDIALNDAGIDQARHLGRHLSSPDFTARIDAVISSDLSRAHETARLAAGHFGHPVVVTPSLRERNFGIYEGQELVMRTQESNGLPVDLDDPIYTNRYPIISADEKMLRMTTPEGVNVSAKQMSPGYRLPF